MVKDTYKGEEMVEITPTAKEALQKFMGDSTDKTIRISYVDMKCSGPTLKISLQDVSQEVIFEEVEGFKVCVDDEVTLITEDQIIDYVKNEEVEGFSISTRGGFSCCGDCSGCGG